jgi:hypothetical protein
MALLLLFLQLIFEEKVGDCEEGKNERKTARKEGALTANKEAKDVATDVNKETRRYFFFGYFLLLSDRALLCSSTSSLSFTCRTVVF